MLYYKITTELYFTAISLLKSPSLYCFGPFYFADLCSCILDVAAVKSKQINICRVVQNLVGVLSNLGLIFRGEVDFYLLTSNLTVRCSSFIEFFFVLSFPFYLWGKDDLVLLLKDVLFKQYTENFLHLLCPLVRY